MELAFGLLLSEDGRALSAEDGRLLHALEGPGPGDVLASEELALLLSEDGRVLVLDGPTPGLAGRAAAAPDSAGRTARRLREAARRGRARLDDDDEAVIALVMAAIHLIH